MAFIKMAFEMFAVYENANRYWWTSGTDTAINMDFRNKISTNQARISKSTGSGFGTQLPRLLGIMFCMMATLVHIQKITIVWYWES